MDRMDANIIYTKHEFIVFNRKRIQNNLTKISSLKMCLYFICVNASVFRKVLTNVSHSHVYGH